MLLSVGLDPVPTQRQVILTRYTELRRVQKFRELGPGKSPPGTEQCCLFEVIEGSDLWGFDKRRTDLRDPFLSFDPLKLFVR